MEKSSGKTQVESFPSIFIVHSSRSPESLGGEKIQPEDFKDRIIFMSMFNDIEWKTDDENCMSNAKNYAVSFSQGHWTFLGPRSEGKCLAILTFTKGNGTVQPTKLFKSTSFLSREILKQKNGKSTIHVNEIQ